MKNKKVLMTISALLILIFHLWINITNLKIEIYLKQLCIIGVDIFFFISAYSISKHKKINYKEFIINRFKNIYIKFIIFLLIYYLISNINIKVVINTLLFINLFIKGGGSFLWFIPSIMILYLLLPIYNNIHSISNKHIKVLLPVITLLVLIITTILISINTNYSSIFIFTNRIPIILIGFYVSKYNILEKINNNKILYLITTSVFLLVGILSTYLVFINNLYIHWYKDIIYIINIPLILGIILLLNNIKSNKVFNIIGSSTLEIYAVQMIIGFTIANTIYKVISIKILSNIITILTVIIISIIINKIFEKITIVLKHKLCYKLIKRKTN